MEFLAIDMYFSCLMLYTKFQDTWNWHISLPHSRSLNYCTSTLLLNFRDWSIPIWHTEMVLLSPCSQILCLFFHHLTRRNTQLQLPLKKSLNLYSQVTLYNYRYVDSAIYIIMVHPYISFTDSDASGTVYE